MAGKKTKYLISIDGSTTCTGIAVFNMNNEKLIFHTHISPKNDKKLSGRENMNKRIEFMMIHISELLNRYMPVQIIMEDTYGAKDLYTYKKLCHLQGLILGYAITNSVNIQFSTPSAWRKKIGIHITENKRRLKRNELKSKAIRLVKEKYGIDVCDDEAEAICIGLSYFANM